MPREAKNAFVTEELKLLDDISTFTRSLRDAVRDYNRAENELEEAKRDMRYKATRVEELANCISNYESTLNNLREKLRLKLEPPPLVELAMTNGQCLIQNGEEEITCRQQ